MLAIGVFRGESLAVWSDWFYNGRILGLDVNLGPAIAYKPILQAKGAFGANNVQLLETDTSDVTRFAQTRVQNPQVRSSRRSMPTLHPPPSPSPLALEKLQTLGPLLLTSMPDPSLHSTALRGGL